LPLGSEPSIHAIHLFPIVNTTRSDYLSLPLTLYPSEVETHGGCSIHFGDHRVLEKGQAPASQPIQMGRLHLGHTTTVRPRVTLEGG
jgi:hypothetical protein